MAYADGSQFLNKDFDIHEYIAQAPTPPPSSVLPEEEWAQFEPYDFGYENLDAIDCDLSSSQKLTLAQTAEISLYQASHAAQQTSQITYIDNSSHQLQLAAIKEEPVDSVVSTTGTHVRASNVPKCMNRNAIAARENRAKKKSEFERLKIENAALKLSNDNYHRENKDLKSRNKALNERLTYLEKSSRDQMRMASALSHFNTNDKYRAFKKAQLRHRQPHNEAPVGVCLYVRPDKEIEFRMCESCANHNGAAGPCVQTVAPAASPVRQTT